MKLCVSGRLLLWLTGEIVVRNSGVFTLYLNIKGCVQKITSWNMMTRNSQSKTEKTFIFRFMEFIMTNDTTRIQISLTLKDSATKDDTKLIQTLIYLSVP